MADVKVVASKADGNVLLLQSTTDRNKGQVLELKRDVLFPMQNFLAIVAQGYWKEDTMSDAKLQHLLDGVRVIPPRGPREG
jgi:hypothetical protein